MAKHRLSGNLMFKADVHARLTRLRDMLELEAHALARCRDERLLDVLVEIDETRLAAQNALEGLESTREQRAPVRLQRVV
jgi:hypothetical protein